MSLINEILFMNEEEADLEADKVMSFGDLFYERSGGDVSEGSSPTAKFATLGASSYLDSPEDYVSRSAESNPTIDFNFNQLLTAVKKSLGVIFNKEIIDLDGAGRVGFHVFDERANGEEAQWHVDMPYENEGIVWSEPPTNPFSFTLPLRLPQGVGGLDFKDEEGKERYYPYTVGNLYLSNGLFPNRIANPIRIRDGENRITLQGHGVFSEVSSLGFVYF